VLHVTFVKKILASGAPCPKCADVEERLQRSGLIHKIDRIIVADERDTESEGMRMARKYDVALAPFFIVTKDSKTNIYTVYLKFIREIFGAKDSTETEEAEDILRSNPNLDLI